MSDAKHSSPIEIADPSSLNEQAAAALVIAGALVAVADRRNTPVGHRNQRAGNDERGRSLLVQAGRIRDLDRT